MNLISNCMLGIMIATSELMARYNARSEALGMAEFDSFVSRLCEEVHEALVIGLMSSLY